MKTNESMSLPTLAFEGGTKAMTLTRVVGTPKREYAETYVPGEEPIEDGELRVTVLGSGNPWPTRAAFTPTQIPPPAWWAEALIPLD
jgi:ribonuclease Z